LTNFPAAATDASPADAPKKERKTMGKNDHSRKAQPVDAVCDGKLYNFRTLGRAAAFAGITPARVREAMQSGESIMSRVSGKFWAFKAGAADAAAAADAPSPAAGPVRAGKASQALVQASAETMRVRAAGDVPVIAPQAALGSALAAIASMAAGFGGVVLSDVAITLDGGSLQLKVGKLEVLRG
jgi:hypothetical protein